ncbi:MAG: FHA domain-containing protein [Bdellovibrionales bacterium]
MSSAVSLSPAAETKWTVISGSMSGSVRLLNVSEFTIGRSPECEFVIVQDPKCSRKHAIVRCSGQRCEIQGLTDKNPPLINGKEASRPQLLRDGDVITVGETQIQFNQTSSGQTGENSLVLVQLGANRPPADYQRPTPPGRKPGRARQANPSSPGMRRVLLYLAVGGILYWLLSPSTQKKPTIDLRTEQQIQADIEAAQKLKEAAEAQAAKKVDRTLTARQAQENYIRGFRDYRKGQYERALISFQACLALNPEHVLCNRYMRLAQRKFDELIQYQVVLGRKYRDQNQYKACRSAFRNVMVMTKDASSPVYQEAKINYEACNSFLQERY